MGIDQRFFGELLYQIGVRRDDGSRLDAGETAFLAKQLEHVLAQTYDIKYPALLARRFIPVNTSVPSGAASFTYFQWDEFGMADVIANYADDLPMVGRFAKEFNAPIRSVADAFQYSLQDLRSAAFAGVNLQGDRAMTARRMIETKIDEIAAKGHSASGIKGFVNNSNVSLTTLPTGTWSTASSSNILKDLYELEKAIENSTKQTFQADTLLLATTSYRIIATKEMSADNTDTVLQTFLKNSVSIRNVDRWWRLDKADAAGTGPRAVCYTRSPEVVELFIPQEFEQLPPQPVNLAFKVPCHARIGGVSIRYPLAMTYADGM